VDIDRARGDPVLDIGTLSRDLVLMAAEAMLRGTGDFTPAVVLMAAERARQCAGHCVAGPLVRQSLHALSPSHAHNRPAP